MEKKKGTEEPKKKEKEKEKRKETKGCARKNGGGSAETDTCLNKQWKKEKAELSSIRPTS